MAPDNSNSRASAAKIRRAAGGKDPSLLKSLVETGWTASDLDSMASGDGKSALHIAAWYGPVESIHYLLGLGCNINRIATGTYNYGKTPIFFATTRCRDDVCMFLLERGANVKIVNNKGQSVLSLAATHLRPETVRKIQEAESSQRGNEWQDYSKTHSDGNIYGDLDPRFLGRPVLPDDCVTELVVNPTTRQSRRGNFARNNPEVGVKAKDQPVKQRRKQREKPPLLKPSQAEHELLERSWDESKAALMSQDGEKLASSLLVIIRFWDGKKQAWIPDAAQRLRHSAAVDERLETIAAATVEVASCNARESLLLQKLLSAATDGSIRVSKKSCPKGNKLGGTDDKPLKCICDSPHVDSQKMWQPVIDAISDSGLSWSVLQNPSLNQEYLSLPNHPIWIDSTDEISGLRYKLADFVHCSSLSPIAFDTEWCSTSSGKIELATIQLSWVEKGTPVASVIDLKPCEDGEALEKDTEAGMYLSAVSDMLRWLFLDSGAPLLGFAIGHDIPKLSYFLKCTISTAICLDLQLFAASKMFSTVQSIKQGALPGLKTCCSHYLASENGEATSGWVLSKKEQCSNWKRRPLSQPQLEYAGLDAGVLLVLLAEIAKR